VIKHWVKTDGNKKKGKENTFLCPVCLYDEMKAQKVGARTTKQELYWSY